MVDFIIVGCGLAGMAFAETALQNGKSILVFDDSSQNSSQVAAGLYNPVILKRFSGLSNSQQQLHMLQEFYVRLELKLGIQVNHKVPVLRRFSSVEEQNNWFIAADKPSMSAYLSTDIHHDEIDGLTSPFGFGEVMQTGFVNTKELLDSYKMYLHNSNQSRYDKFQSDDLEFFDNMVRIGTTTAKHIVFAEGFGLHQNQFFNYLPLDGTKGELLTIKAPDLKLTQAVNSSIFILPLGNHLFKVGATYNWSDKSSEPTVDGKNELIEKLKEIVTCDFEIISHEAGVRPTVRDRKPLLGSHPLHKNVHILNGLGTRGVMLGPYLARELYDFILANGNLDKENDIARFTRFYPFPYCSSQKD